MKLTVCAVGLGALWLTCATSTGAQVADHLKCYKVKDSQAKTIYKADLGGLVAEPGCFIKVPGTLLCVGATKMGVTPTPPGGPDTAGLAGRFLCYKVKCPKATLAALQWHDQFGSRMVTPSTPKIVCAPEILPTTTTTTPTTSTTTTTLCGSVGESCCLGNVCTSGVCNGGMCVTPSCTDGIKDGTETDIDCGGGTCPPCAVGKMCALASDCVAPPNATPGCSGGTCGVGSCSGGFANCDNMPTNGCEVSTNTDPMNCGSCGHVCALQAQSTCGMNGQCSAGACTLYPAGTACGPSMTCNGSGTCM